ncbi:hypothetical protein [Acuticoccus sp. I52.16.1]|uniref:hypothetical protein n=1 Tax=Acuticoccus sp. I52.16.1 TaxID=2928472 RepID=UPI001FD5BE36|nr:hypothetical protein [Acuticoccus sp. I52.16.1]UOM34834.1 hypothetical protein MRB58_01060 [Acuticoccus sp. I52.16.1]
MLERILSVIAFAVLCGFLFILTWHVPRIDLTVVLIATVLLSGYDILIHRPPGAK